MIVDDDAAFQHAICFMIERDGALVVSTAANGAEAIERAEVCRPDILLIDVRLGPESGFDVARRIEARAAVAASGWRPLIILVSTQSEDELADRIAANPSFGFLDKTMVSFGKIRDLHLAWAEGAAGAASRSRPNWR